MNLPNCPLTIEYYLVTMYTSQIKFPFNTTHSLTLAKVLLVLLILFGVVENATAYAAAGGVSKNFIRFGHMPLMPNKTKEIGKLSSAAKLSVDVFLKPQHQNRINRLLNSIYNVSSSNYHHFLTKGQFLAEFGPSPAEYENTVSYLRLRGLKNLQISPDGFAVHVNATASQLEKAFSVSFAEYKLPGGRKVYANTQRPLFPSTVADNIQGMSGLDDLAVMKSNAVADKTPTSKRFFKNKAPIGRHYNSSKLLKPLPATGGPQVVPQSAPSGTASFLYTACEAGAQKTLFNSGSGGYAAWTYPQLAGYYGFSSLYADGAEGQNTNIALIELQNDYTNQINYAWNCFTGNSGAAPVTYIPVDGGQGLGSSGAGTGAAGGEATLDIEIAMALAPKSNILVYQGNSDSTAEYYNALSAIVKQDSAKVISDSYSLCEYAVANSNSGLFASENSLLQQAALQGQTFFAASGDTGSSACAGSNASHAQLGVNDPASQPYATGVGGTSLECGVYSNGVLVPSTAFLSDSGTGCMNTGSSGAVSFQTAWNNAQEFNQPTSHYLVSTNSGGYVSAFASGGGVSQVFPMPTYQSSGANSISGLIESGYSSGGATCGVSVGTYCREVPDVSANADPAWGYLIYYAKKWTGFGGTSTATPLWAAYMADTDSLSSCGNNPVGFINKSLYQLASTSSGKYLSPVNNTASAFGGKVTNNEYNSGSSGAYPVLNTTYDMVTGLGTPTAGLGNALCGMLSPTTTTTTSTTTTAAPTTTTATPVTTSVVPTGTTAAPTPTTTTNPPPLSGHLIFRNHVLGVFGRTTYLLLTCQKAACVGSVRLFMEKLLIVHKLVHLKKRVVKRTIKRKELIVVAVGKFRIAKSGTRRIKLVIRPAIAKLISQRKKLVILGTLREVSQKPVTVKFFLVHRFIKKKKAKPTHKRNK